MANPFLSIGIIFKNEIRCLERCLNSLTPLREAVPCELVMADTGADDGSREVAEKYADILIDFPWINDFAAARNAVMDRCTGRWHLFVDADEWLDGDIKELVSFLRSNNRKAHEACTVKIRNYFGTGPDADFSDFMGVRMLRMSTGVRFQGAIHETWKYEDGRLLHANPLSKTILHHDGYVGLNSASGEAKRERNKAILREELEKDPENVRFLLQYIESSGPDLDRIDFIRRGIAATEAQKPDWAGFGPVVFRYAVAEARARNLPDFDGWVTRAEELFPQSFYTIIDVYYYAFLYNWEKRKDYSECIRLGEGYLRAKVDYDAGRGDQAALMVSTLHFATAKWERAMRIVLAHAYLKNGQAERAAEMLGYMEFQLMDGEQTRNMILFLRELHTETEVDTAPLVRRMYAGICRPEPSEIRAVERKNLFVKEVSGWFSMGYLKNEEQSEKFRRHACGLLAPLAGQFDLGDAAATMAAETVTEKEKALAAAEKPYQMPREVLRRAILAGVTFPLPQKPLKLEELDSLADRLARRDGLEILKQAAGRISESVQQLAWARGVALAVVSAWEWPNNEESMTLVRAFVKVGEAFLSRCYAPEILCEEAIRILPPVHRFSWYVGRAFEALEAGDAVGYARLLRTGLESCPKMKPMVEFLTEHTPQLKPPVPGELLALAEQVRTMLAAYAPDDPAVLMIKRSAAYQKVAHLIEGNGSRKAQTPASPEKRLELQTFRSCLNNYPAMSDMLKAYSYQEILKQAAALADIDPANLESHPMGGYSKGMTSGAYRFVLQDLLKNIAHYDWLYSRLEDDISREVYTNLISFRLFPALSYIQAACDTKNPQYFDKSIVICDENEVFVDCGGFIGDSAESFIQAYGKYKHIYVYEPLAENIQACHKSLEKYDNITIRQCGVGERETVLAVEDSGSSGTFMRAKEAEDTEGIRIISLDTDIKERITYCKMDIEGFEIPALLGAKRHIQNDFPKLAICVYHIVTDIWEIPRLIDKLHPGYRLFMRHYHPEQNWETVIYAIPTEEM